MIVKARQEMIPRLKEIWKNCFHDEDEYIDFYYSNRFPQVETLVNVVNGVPAAMVTLVPGKLTADGQVYDLRYIYAVATDPSYQGMGLASELMNEIKEHVGKEYDAVFLVPAGKSLFDYYARFGYETVCDKKVVTFCLEDLTEPSMVQFDHLLPSQLHVMREQSFRHTGYVEWDVNALDYLMKEYELCQGKVVKVTTENKTGSLFYYYNSANKILYIKETSLSLTELQPVLGELANVYQIDHFEVIVPSCYEKDGVTIPFVMAYGNGISHIKYVNFVKD